MLPLHPGSPPADCEPPQPGTTHDGSGSVAGVAHPLSVAGHPAVGAPPTLIDGPQGKTRVVQTPGRADWPRLLIVRERRGSFPSAKPQDDHHGPGIPATLTIQTRRPCDRGTRIAIGTPPIATAPLPTIAGGPPERRSKRGVMGDGSVGGRRARIRPVRLQRIQELSETGWVVQEQPANHCLKSCRHSINRCVATPGAATGTVPTSANQVQFMLIKRRLKTLPSASA